MATLRFDVFLLSSIYLLCTVEAQCEIKNLETTEVLSTQLSISWTCFDREADDEFRVDYQLDNGDQCYYTWGHAQSTGWRAWSSWDPQLVSGDTYQLTATLPYRLPFSTYDVWVITRYTTTVVHTFPTTGEAEPSGPPEKVTVTDVGQRSLSLTWMQPMCGVRNGYIKMYSYELIDQYRNTRMTSNTSETSIELTDLTPYVQYGFKVAAWTSAGQGPFSDTIVRRTLEYTTCSAINTSTPYPLAWPEADIGQTVESFERCPDYSSKVNPGPRATRQCKGDLISGSEWQTVIINDCLDNMEITEVNKQLEVLSKTIVTEKNVTEVAVDLAQSTNDTNGINATGLVAIALNLERIISVTSPQVTTYVVETVDNLLDIANEEFVQGVYAKAPTRILKSFEEQISTIQMQEDNFTANGDNVDIFAVKLPQTSFDDGLGFASVPSYDTQLFNNPDDIPVEVEASIVLPMEVVARFRDAVNASAMVPVSFVLYQNSKLFQSQQLRDESTSNVIRQVGSRVISATIEGLKITGLVQPVESTFLMIKPENFYHTIKNVQCVFWDFDKNDGNGDWSTDGCRRADTTDGDRIMCHCDHLTSFAVLIDVHGQKFSSLALDVISKIGCGISITALIITIVTYLSSKSLRNKTPKQILICLSFTLLGLYMVFVIGVDQTESYGCIAVAVLLHYLTLSTVAWMGVEAINLYLLFIKVFNAHVSHFMLKACILAWGGPLVPVILVLAIDMSQYYNDHHCFMQADYAFYFADLLLLFLILTANFVIFIMLIYEFTCRRKVARSSDRDNKQAITRAVNAVAISSILGLTWVFGFLTIIENRESSIAFQVLFCIFNSLQGFAIFLLFCVRSEDVRNVWKRWFGCGESTARSNYSGKKFVATTGNTLPISSKTTAPQGESVELSRTSNQL